MKMQERLEAIWRSWEKFFFAPVPTLSIAVFRIAFALNLLAMYSIRALDWRFYFTDAGFIHSDQALDILPEFYRPVFAWYPTTATAALVMQAAFLFSLFCLMIGFRGRLVAFLSFVLHLAFMQRNFAIVYGADLISTFFLFGLIWVDNSRELSFDAWLRNRRGVQRSAHELNSIFNTVGLRLMQVQLCIIYGFTGMEKLKGQSWWDGTAVWSVLGNRQIMLWDTSWLRHVPLVIAGMTLGTILFEVYFPVLVWVKPIRKWLLLFGLVLHCTIAFTVGLFFFSFAMLSTYILFIDDAWLGAQFRKRSMIASATRMPSQAADVIPPA